MAQFHHFSICNQYQSISNLVILWQNTKAIALLFGQNWLMLMTFQSAIKITQILKFPQFLAKYLGYSLTFWPNMAHFHHFSNLQSKSINFKFGHFVAQYQGYSLTFWPKMAHFHHFSILQSKSINFKFGHGLGQYQGYSLTFWPKWLIFITFYTAIKINQFQIWSLFGIIPRL